MKRNDILIALENYNPKCSFEEEHRKKIISFIKNNINCFDRTCKTGHLTASSWIENSRGTQVLLMHHKKLCEWLQLGGHSDGDPDLLNVAIKEAKEESGLDSIVPVSTKIFDVEVHLIPPYLEVPEHYHYDLRFFLKSLADGPLIKNSESNDLRWFGKDSSALPTQNPSILRMFEKWLDINNFKINNA